MSVSPESDNVLPYKANVGGLTGSYQHELLIYNLKMKLKYEFVKLSERLSLSCFKQIILKSR